MCRSCHRSAPTRLKRGRGGCGCSRTHRLSGRRAPGSAFPARQPQRGSLRDARRNPDGDRLVPRGPPGGPAGRAGLIDDASSARALRARGHLTEPTVRLGGWPPYAWPGAAAARAATRRGAGTRSAARALRTGARTADRDHVIDPGHHLLQRDGQIHGSHPRRAAGSPTAGPNSRSNRLPNAGAPDPKMSAKSMPPHRSSAVAPARPADPWSSYLARLAGSESTP